MVEVLVASTILIVIVMMMAMLFQQTSDAWRTGLMRANGYMQLRSYIGAIQRDASRAIDAKNLPADILSQHGKQAFDSKSMSFYALAGDMDNRSLKYITHDTSGRRTESVLSLDGNGRWEPETSSQILNFLSTGKSSGDDPTISAGNFQYQWSNGTERDNSGATVALENRLPLYIRLDAEIVQRGKLYSVGAASAGPDGQWNTKDDIKTW